MDQLPLLQSCSSFAFKAPDILGLHFTKVQANLVTNFSAHLPEGLHLSHYETDIVGLDFCNVSLTYTHPGYNDAINNQVWLPLTNYNGRLQGVGGGGFRTGLWYEVMYGAVSDGYVVTSTDGGHEGVYSTPETWAFSSTGNIDWNMLQNFASITLNDAAIIGKSITEQFYGQPPKYSYFSGCSTGGRQGLMLAQRYPQAYDGILATAPAINWASFLPSTLWPQVIMSQLNTYPHPCELDAITAAVIAACDANDGVEDSIISAPELCKFDPHTLIGTEASCPDTADHTITISPEAVTVAIAAWTGPISPNDASQTPLYPGVTQETPLTGIFSVANTVCHPRSSATNCTGQSFSIAENWLRYYLSPFNLYNPASDSHDGDGTQTPPSEFNLHALTPKQLISLIQKSVNVYSSILSTNDPDLSGFKDRKGKMITWHGTADALIPAAGTEMYYKAVEGFDPHVRDYYRYFEAPGLGHCFNGTGPFPGKAFDDLVKWVEEGVAPDVLEARADRSKRSWLANRDDFGDGQGGVWERMLCVWPKRAIYKGEGDARKRDSWQCE